MIVCVCVCVCVVSMRYVCRSMYAEVCFCRSVCSEILMCVGIEGNKVAECVCVCVCVCVGGETAAERQVQCRVKPGSRRREAHDVADALHDQWSSAP